MRKGLLAVAVAVAVAVVAGAPGVAESAEPTLYTVLAGDTCPIIAQKIYGSAKRIDLLHANNDLGPVPHHLKPGLVLRLPPATPGGADALLTFLRNRVDAYTPQQHSGRKNEPLSRGDKVSTLMESSAEVSFGDETQLQLGEHSLVVILGDNRGAVRKLTAADTTLLTGTLRAHLAELAGGKPAPPVSLGTPGARVRLGRGEAQLQVDERQSTRLAVYRGTSGLRAAGKEVKVPAGFGSRADKGRAPTAPRPLPAAPEWAAAPTLVLTAGGAADVSATFRAGSGQGAVPARFRVQLARDERFNDLIVDARVPATTLQLEARNLSAGTYLGRVAAIDADHFEGPSSAAWPLRVATLTVRLVAGHPVLEVPPGLVCGVDGEVPAPSAHIALAAGQPHLVGCALAKNPSAVARLALPSTGTVDAPPPPTAPEPPEPAPAPQVEPVAPRVAPVASPVAPPPSVRNHVEVAVLAGVTLSPITAQAGLAAGIELGGAQWLPKGSLHFALRLGYEYFPVQTALAVPCPMVICPLRNATGSYTLLLDRHVARLGLPIAYHFPELQRRFQPYLGLVPEVLLDFAQTREGLLQRTGVAIGGHAGLQIRLGPGGLLLELGYRQVFMRPDARDQAPLHSLLLHSGYRFSW
jgi:nucleoid-associated protein YgaU